MTTYGDVAAALGACGVARHVGWARGALPVATRVACHRVVNAKGEVTARADGVGDDAQRLRLLQEGIALDARGRIIGFAALRVTPRPLPDDAPTPPSSTRARPRRR